VHDAGCGIPESVRSRMFDRFYRADEWVPNDSAQGHGLGLAIAKSAVEANGGTIGATSSPAGSTFKIALPLSTDRSHHSSVRSSPEGTHGAVTNPGLQPA